MGYRALSVFEQMKAAKDIRSLAWLAWKVKLQSSQQSKFELFRVLSVTTFGHVSYI